MASRTADGGVTADVVRREGRIDEIVGTHDTLFKTAEELQVVRTASAVGASIGALSWCFSRVRGPLSWNVTLLTGLVTFVSVMGILGLDGYKLGTHPFVLGWNYAANAGNYSQCSEHNDMQRRLLLDLPMGVGTFSVKPDSEVRTFPFFTMRVSNVSGNPNLTMVLMFFYNAVTQKTHVIKMSPSRNFDNPFAVFGAGDLQPEGVIGGPAYSPKLSEELSEISRYFAKHADDRNEFGVLSNKVLHKVIQDITLDNRHYKILDDVPA